MTETGKKILDSIYEAKKNGVTLITKCMGIKSNDKKIFDYYDTRKRCCALSCYFLNKPKVGTFSSYGNPDIGDYKYYLNVDMGYILGFNKGIQGKEKDPYFLARIKFFNGYHEGHQDGKEIREICIKEDYLNVD